MFKLKDKITAVYDKRKLMKLEKVDKDGSLQVDMANTQLEEKDKTNSEQQKKSATITYKQNKELFNEYILREGHEREWIENVKLLINSSKNKALDEGLTELMPLVRYHSDVSNELKAKRMAMNYETYHESLHVFLDRLSQMYGSNKSEVSKQKINKKIKCNKCKKRGHLRKNCQKNKTKAVIGK